MAQKLINGDEWPGDLRVPTAVSLKVGFKVSLHEPMNEQDSMPRLIMSTGGLLQGTSVMLSSKELEQCISRQSSESVHADPDP